MYKDLDDVFVHFYDDPRRFVPETIVEWFHLYRGIKAGYQLAFHRDELHYRFGESVHIYENYLIHFSNLIQEREAARNNTALANRARGYI